MDQDPGVAVAVQGHDERLVDRAVDAVSSYADTCVIIPMFNEGQVVAETVAKVRAVFPLVICVDDGSTDGSGLLAEAAGARVVRHPTNLGAGAAMQTGFELALKQYPAARYFLTFDADGQHQVADAVTMVTEARKGMVDVVLGSRFLDNTTRMPRSRQLMLKAAVRFTNLSTGLALTDTHNGLRVFNRRAALTLDLRHSGMAHGSEVLSGIARHGLTFREMPVQILYTDYSRRKGQSNINAVNILFDLLVAKLRFAR